MRYWRLVSYAILFVAVAIASSLVSSGYSNKQIRSGLRPSALVLAAPERGFNPAAITPGLSRRQTFITPAFEYAQSYSSVPGDHVLSVSECLHLLKMFGADVSVQANDGSTLRVLDVITDAGRAAAVFGKPTIVKTSFGVRFPTGRNSGGGASGNETHRDQALATLAGIGLPLTTELNLDGERFTLMDVLQDSVANFHLKQRELEWSTLAYVKYLVPGTRVWTNRYGESFSFDGLALEMLNRHSGMQSCGGLHCLMALSALHQVDGEYHILTSEIRKEVAKRLKGFVVQSTLLQEADGRWHPGWTLPKAETNAAPEFVVPYRRQSATLVEYVLATGHTCEWLLGLPEEFEVPEDVVAKASTWLSEAVHSSTPEDRWSSFCPWSHAVQTVFLTTHFGKF